MKHDTHEIMKSLSEKFPGLLVLILNFDEEANTADIAMTVSPKTAAIAMRSLGGDMCEKLGIVDQEVN